MGSGRREATEIVWVKVGPCLQHGAAMRLAMLIGCVVVTSSATAGATDTWTTVHPGMRRLHRVTATQNINALVIDLCAPGVSVRATTHAERGRTVASFGSLVGAQAAINANYFNLTTYETTGPAMGNGVAWGGSDSTEIAPVQFGDYRVTLAAGTTTAAVAPWAKQVVSGRPSLVVGGVLKDASAASTCDAANPRTGLGLTADKEHLIVAVVDGRATDRVGMTCNELGTLLKGLGATDAINLDGGGSSTMWLSGTGVINNPSDGVARSVGNHLAIHATGTGAAPNCPRARYTATLVAGDTELAMTSGDRGTMAIDVTNDGNVPWDTSTKVGTQDPQDRDSVFFDADTWLAPDRPTAADQAYAPGAAAHFEWSLVAPEVTEPTTFVEAFQLVQENVTWFGPTHTVTITVSPRAGEDPNPDGGGAGGCMIDRDDLGGIAIVFVFVWRRRRRAHRHR